MNKVTTVNLNGNAFQLEENGYEALRAYLAAAGARLAGNPDRDEILSDIEQAIADKFRAVLGAYKTVVAAPQVEAVIAEMGPVDAGETAGDASAPPPETADREAAAGSAPEGRSGQSAGLRRLYRLYDGAIFAGVCNGVAAYFNLDPAIVRIVFVILTIVTSGAWLLVYLVMMFVVPAADTPAQRTAARGATTTAQEFIRRAKQGYYESARKFGDRKARREWKRKFRREMRGWRHAFQWEMPAGAAPWQTPGAPFAGSSAAWSFLAPMLTVVHAVLAFACLGGLLSLLTTGSVLGLPLPAELPVWAAVLLLLFAYSLVVVPIKLARHVYWRQLAYGGHPSVGAVVHLCDALVWLAFLLIVGFWSFRHLPQVMDAVHSVPAHAHQAADAVRAWWSR